MLIATALQRLRALQQYVSYFDSFPVLALRRAPLAQKAIGQIRHSIGRAQGLMGNSGSRGAMAVLDRGHSLLLFFELPSELLILQPDLKGFLQLRSTRQQ